MKEELENPHPGIILKKEFLEELNISMNQLAKSIGVPVTRLHYIIKGTRGISADTDLRLSRYFGLSEGFWLRLQNQYDLMKAKRVGEFGKIEPYRYQ